MTQPSPSTGGRVPLTWVSDENPLRKEQTALFQRNNPGITVNLDPGSSALEKIIVQSLAGVGPDVFDAFDGFQLAAYVKSGVAMDVTDELKSHGLDLKRDVFPGLSVNCFFEGRTYGVPTNIAADGTWYHAEILRKEGIQLPQGEWRWSEMIPIAEKLTKRDPTGKVLQYGLLFDWWNWMDFFAGYNARLFTPDGRTCIVNQPEAVAAVQMMRDLVYKYKVAPTPGEESSMSTAGGFGSGTITFFGARRGAMAIGGRWWLSQLRSYKGLDLGVTESPTGTIRQYRAYGRATLVNKNSPHLKEALEFQRFMASLDYLKLVNNQADGIAAFPAADQGDAFLHNPKHPEETFNAVWKKIADHSAPDEVSPFIDAGSVAREMKVQMDLVQAGQKSAQEAMAAAARNINAAIAKGLKEDPALAKRFRDLDKP